MVKFSSYFQNYNLAISWLYGGDMSLFTRFTCAYLIPVCLLVLSGVSISQVEANELQINQNKQCIGCHKRNGNMHGVHGKDELSLSCQSCHGEKGKHPRGDSTLVWFSSSEKAKEKSSTQDQVNACLQCHDHEALYEAEWTHAVHSNKVNCASCHALHGEKDPMVGVSEKARSELCVSCHSKMNEEKTHD